MKTTRAKKKAPEPVPEKPDDHDPEPRDRVWYEHRQTGDRGWMVRRDGKDWIRLDRGPRVERLQPVNPAAWRQVNDYRPMTEHQLAQVAFEADRKLCFFLGQHERSRKEWESLSDKARIRYVKEGPGGDHRQVLYDAIMGATEYMRDAKG